MDQNNHRRFYAIKFKLQVVDYAKEHRNRAAERSFGPSPSEKLASLAKLSGQIYCSTSKGNNKTCLHIGKVNWSELEELKPWVENNRNVFIAVLFSGQSWRKG